jgi:AcrR family transcriptional regulator
MPRRPGGAKSIARRMRVLRVGASGVKRAQPRPREARSAARREAILAAALDEFSVHGFEAARLDEVARRAGIAKGTIYLYFQGKESLFQELVRTMLTPVVGTIEAMGEADLPSRALADRIADFFVREIYETRRRDVIRLMIAEGPRFPQLAEFYYREVLSRIIAAMRVLLTRAAARGEVPAALVDFPQIVAAPAMIAVVWSGLFERFEPLDVRAMMKTHIDLLFSRGEAP